MIYSGLLLVFIFEYMRPGSYVPALGVLNSIIPLGMFALSLFISPRASNGEVLQERNALWILFFVLLVGVSVLTAEVQFNAFLKFRQVVGYFFLFFMIVKLTADLRRLKILFATLAFIHVGLILLNPDLILKPEIRSYIQGVTFLGDGNDFSLSVTIVIPMCLFLLLEAKAKWLKLLYLMVLGLLLFSIIGTSSRGAAIAILAVLLYLWLRSQKKLLGIVALTVVALAVLVFAPPSYFERMETVKDYETESSAQGRLRAWAAAIRMAKDHPLLGVGSGHFGMMYSNRYRPADYDGDTMGWLTAHSIYFLTLGELGIPGVIILLSIIIGNLRENGRRLRDLKRIPSEARETYRRLFVCLDSSMIAFAVGGAFLSAIYYPHLYVITALMTVAGLFYRDLLEQAPIPGADSSGSGSVPLPHP